jgi:hypothetical protein
MKLSYTIEPHLAVATHVFPSRHSTIISSSTVKIHARAPWYKDPHHQHETCDTSSGQKEGEERDGEEYSKTCPLQGEGRGEKEPPDLSSLVTPLSQHLSTLLPFFTGNKLNTIPHLLLLHILSISCTGSAYGSGREMLGDDGRKDEDEWREERRVGMSKKEKKRMVVISSNGDTRRSERRDQGHGVGRMDVEDMLVVVLVWWYHSYLRLFGVNVVVFPVTYRDV